MSEKINILLLEDNAYDVELIDDNLKDSQLNFIMTTVATREGYIKGLQNIKPDLILSDYSLPQFDGKEAIKLVKEISPDTPIIIVTGSINEETAVECMKAGAMDYILKENMIRLVPAIKGVLERIRLVKQKEQAEVHLRENQERYAKLFQQSNDGIFIHDIDENIIEANEKILKLFGFTQDEIKSLQVKDLHPVYEQKRSSQALERITRDGSAKFEIDFKKKNADIFPAEISASVFEVGGKKLIQTILRDITARKQAENALHNLNLALRKSNQEIKNFVYVISHDLTEPLRKITSFGDFIIEEYGTKLNDVGRSYIYKIKAAAEHMQQLILNLLDISQVGFIKKKLSTVNTNKMLNDLLIRLNFKKNHGTGIFENQDNVQVFVEDLPEIKANSHLITQLFHNLIDNSIKFRKKDGIAKIEISAVTESSWVTFSVEDNGIGIEQRFLEKIFDMFQRLHKREEYCGTGIGLALCKKIIEQHEGKIWCESVLGQGTTFYFTLKIR